MALAWLSFFHGALLARDAEGIAAAPPAFANTFASAWQTQKRPKRGRLDIFSRFQYNNITAAIAVNS